VLDTATSKDSRAVLRLIEEAGWAYTRDEIDRLIAVQPDGMLLLRSTGLRHSVLGCVYASVWGQVGFIGLMLVSGTYRRMGLGTEMMMAAMDHLRAHGTTSVCLDAVADATGFYRNLGFKTSWQSLRFGMDTSKAELGSKGVDVVHAGAAEVERAIELDRSHSGLDRKHLMRRLFKDRDSTFLVVPAEKEVTGFAVLRRSKGCMRLGPVVARPRAGDPLVVRSLVIAAMAESYPRMLTVNVPSYNREATEMMVSLGATQYAPCTRMFKGHPGPADSPEGVWALGAAEKG
jgi:GNAT superfamily N-acetyltransferase